MSTNTASATHCHRPHPLSFFLADDIELDSYAQAAHSYFSKFSPDMLAEVTKEVDDADVTDVLTAIFSESVRHENVNGFRAQAVESEWPDASYSRSRRSGEGIPVDFKFTAKSGQRYMLGFHYH